LIECVGPDRARLTSENRHKDLETEIFLSHFSVSNLSVWVPDWLRRVLIRNFTDLSYPCNPCNPCNPWSIRSRGCGCAGCAALYCNCLKCSQAATKFSRLRFPAYGHCFSRILFLISDLGFQISDFLRISIFGIRISGFAGLRPSRLRFNQCSSRVCGNPRPPSLRIPCCRARLPCRRGRASGAGSC
jgi:hypothetical protein